MDVPRAPSTLWVPADENKAERSKEATRDRKYTYIIGFVKLLALMGVILDGVFHWLESGTWIGTFDFVLDDFWDVENEALGGPGYLQGMQFISVVAHLTFLAGLMILLVMPIRMIPGGISSGIKQVSDIPSKGKGVWLTALALGAVATVAIVALILAIKGSGIIYGGE